VQFNVPYKCCKQNKLFLPFFLWGIGVALATLGYTHAMALVPFSSTFKERFRLKLVNSSLLPAVFNIPTDEVPLGVS